MRKQRGMTLTEILIVLLLVLLLATLLTPSYETYFSQNAVKGAAEALYSDFIRAKTTAIGTGQTVTVTFTTGATWCYGLSSGSIACTCGSAPSASNCDLGITSYTSYANTSLSTSGFTSDTVIFDSARGVVTNTAGSATFTASGGENITTSINKFGAPKICSSTVGGYSACS